MNPTQGAGGGGAISTQTKCVNITSGQFHRGKPYLMRLVIHHNFSTKGKRREYQSVSKLSGKVRHRSWMNPEACVYGEFVLLYSCLMHTKEMAQVTGTATRLAPLLFTSGSVRYEALPHSCGTNPVLGMGTDISQCTHGVFIVLPH